MVSFMLFLTVQVNAQDKGDLRASAGLVYGEGIEEAGINIGGEYFFTSKITGAPSFTAFFVGGGGSITQWNLDARYYLLKGSIQLYGLAGYASLRASADAGFGRITVSNGGFNFGAGAVFPLKGRLGINTQLKYSTPGSGQALLQAGVVYKFK